MPRALRVGWDDQGELGGRGLAPLADRCEERLAQNRLVHDHEHVGLLARRLGDRPRCAHWGRPQPCVPARSGCRAASSTSSAGCVEMMISSGRYSWAASLIACSGSGSATAPRCDSASWRRSRRAPRASLGARAAAVGVDDEARARLVLRGDDGDADRAFGGALRRRRSNLAGDRLVGHDEDVPRLAAQWTFSGSGSSTGTRSPFMTAVAAPRTPYSVRGCLRPAESRRS